MRTISVSAAVVLALLATPVAAAPCRTADLDGAWVFDAFLIGDDDASFSPGFARCEVIFRREQMINVTCQAHTPYYLPSLEAWTHRSEYKYELALSRSCHFDWEVTNFDEGYFMHGQMNQGKDVINGSIDVRWSNSGVGKFTLAKLPKAHERPGRSGR